MQFERSLYYHRFVYFAIIDEKYLSADDAGKLEQKPVLLPIWDAFYEALR